MNSLSLEELILWTPPVFTVKSWQRQLTEIRSLLEVRR